MTLALTSLPPLAWADNQPTVAEARQLFAEALRDADASRYADALAKLQKVQAVRDTSPVRYQIARCTENLGRIAKSREMYLRTVDGTQIPSNEDPSIASASRDAAARLASKVGYVRVDGAATRGPERLLGVDDDEWAGAGLREVDPGRHVLRVENSDRKSVRTVDFSVTAGSTSSVRIFPDAPDRETRVATEPAKPREAPEGSPTPWSWVSLGAGAALLATGVTLLVVRETDIGHIEDTCPSGRCPESSRDDIESTQSRARTFGVLGITGTAVGVAGLAVGAGLLLFGPRSHDEVKTASWSPMRWAARSGIAPTRGGGQLWIGAAF